MPENLLDGHTIEFQVGSAVEVAPERTSRPALFSSSTPSGRQPKNPVEHAKRRSADRQIITVKKRGEELRAAVVDLGFELFTRGEPTPEVITNIVKRYLVIALEAKSQQPGQRTLVVILRAKPEILAKVEANNPANPHDPASHVFVSPKGEGKSQRIPLEVFLQPEAKNWRVKTLRNGRVQGEEIRQLLQNLREPGSE